MPRMTWTPVSSPARTASFRPPVVSAARCVEVIKAAGGKVSLAHPYQINIPNEDLDVLVGQLAACGLDAIECFYSKHSPNQEAFYLYLAEKYHLHVTGGSDFHGEKVKPDVQLAKLNLEVDWLAGF